MSEYTYADVIIDPEDSRVEIGKEYYFGESPIQALNFANDNGRGAVLSMVDSEDELGPFWFRDIGYSHAKGAVCIIRKKEPKKKYVPFDLSDAVVREQLWGKRIVIKDEYIISAAQRFPREIHSIITGFIYCPEGEPKDDWTIDVGDYSLTAEEALEKAFFYDETPCGKLVEEE